MKKQRQQFPTTQVQDTKAFIEKHKALQQEGFVPLCSPGKYIKSDRKRKEVYLADIARAQLSMSADSNNNTSIPLLFASSGGEQLYKKKGSGTEGLGWMEWGAGNQWPIVCANLTSVNPYTAASWKFNTDLLAGRGPQPMYRYSQYVAGNVTVREIPVKDAGILLKGRMKELKKEIFKAETEMLSDDGRNTSASQTHAKEYIAAIQEEMDLVKSDYDKWKKSSTEIEDFLRTNNFSSVYQSLNADYTLLGMCFPEIVLNQQQLSEDKRAVKTEDWRPKVVGIRYRAAHTCRLERMSEGNRIRYVYVSNKWYEEPNLTVKDESLYPVAIPALSQGSPLQDLKDYVREAREKKVAVNNRPTRFILPISYHTSGCPYYPRPAWHSIFGGAIYEYATNIIEDRNTRKRNSNVIGRVIYIHSEYLDRLYALQGADVKKSKEDLRDELYDSINRWLSNRDNAGQSLLGFTFTGMSDGKDRKSIEIVEIVANEKSQAEANQKELQEISSVIFFAMGTDSKLIGNTPGDTSSGGGTDLRERYLLKQVQNASSEALLTMPWNVASRMNRWDEHIVWRVGREVLTTLDNSKTGVVPAEDS